VRSHEVSGSVANRELFALMARAAGAEISAVPTFFLCGRMVVGFDDELGTGRQLLQIAESCKDKPAPAPSGTSHAVKSLILPLLGKVDPTRLSLPAATVLIGALDAFNPCAFFVLLFLLSLLIHGRSRGRMAIVGGIFVLISGLLYFAFMAAWLNLFLLLSGLEVVTAVAGIVAIALGLLNVKDFVLQGHGPSLSMGTESRGRLMARMRTLVSADRLPHMLAATVALAAVANLYELLCTSGLPLVYTRILTLRDMPRLDYYLYLALYNAVYVLPLALIVAAFILTLGSRKMSAREGRALKLLSGLMMLGLGAVLVIEPPCSTTC
jgi:hypothetical protein